MNEKKAKRLRRKLRYIGRGPGETGGYVVHPSRPRTLLLNPNYGRHLYKELKRHE